jgi:hypothetical protein
MGSIRHNRQDAADYLKGGLYKLDPTDAIFIGEPVKYSGTSSGGAVNGPVYDKIIIVRGYSDTASKERCLGVSDDQIPVKTGNEALHKSQHEWRQGRREVGIVVGGVRDMINKTSGYEALDNDIVAPYPGGFVRWVTGMTVLGKVKKGPITWNDRGPIVIENRHVSNDEGWNDNGP